MDEFHGEVRLSAEGSLDRSCIIDLRDAGVLQPPEGLCFVFETAQHVAVRVAGTVADNRPPHSNDKTRPFPRVTRSCELYLTLSERLLRWRTPMYSRYRF
jgi:hypothetical protein